MIVISKPINGISINGDEYLLDENNEHMEFDSIEVAKEFLIENGLEVTESFNFRDSVTLEVLA